MSPSKKEIVLGILVGLAIGIPALVIALLLSRSGGEGPAGQPTASVPVEGVGPEMPTTQDLEADEAMPVLGATTAVLPTPTVQIQTETVTHTVEAGETLLAIALDYDVTLEDLVEANAIDDPDFINIGTVLTVPIPVSSEVGGAVLTATVVPTGTMVPELPLTLATPPSVTVAMLSAGYPSALEGELTEAYPVTEDTLRFAIHYTPGTYPEEDIDSVSLMLQGALGYIEAVFGSDIEGSFDVYVAGSPFAPPNQVLRARSVSASRHLFILHDGTGSRADQLYGATRAMTRLFAWNVFGRPVSAMLSEGVAVYAGSTAIADAGHVPVQSFCRAYQIADALPRVSSGLLFEDYVGDLPNYCAAGCFVGYLIESYGVDKFAQLYPTGRYSEVYGKTLATLESEWRAALADGVSDAELDPDALIAGVQDVSAAYGALFADFEDNEAAWEAYLALDAARMALMEGRLDDIAPHLAGAGY